MAGRRHALLIGIGSYEQLRKTDLGRPLEGCVNDVQRLYPILVGRGFRVRFLLDQRATRARIVRAVDRLIDGTEPGDAVLLCFSGVGSRVRAEGWPRWHRTLVPHDSARESSDYANLDIFDVEIDSWAERLDHKNVHATLILDACPSGMPDAGDRANRSVVPDERAQDWLLGDEEEARLPAALVEELSAPDDWDDAWGWIRDGRQAAVIAACGDDGAATETLNDDGIPHGTLTHYLARALEEGYAETTWTAIDWRQVLTTLRHSGLSEPRLEGFAGGGEAPASDETPPAVDDEETPPQYALLIGVGRYPFVPKSYGRPLKGPLNDVQILHEALASQGFHIRILLDHYATRERILAAVVDLYDVPAGATVFIHHSGHGDHLEGRHWRRHFQTLVPFDSGRKDLGPNRDIFDTEIDLWIKHLNRRTPYVTLTFDSCHSGGVSRSAGDDVARSLEQRDERSPEEIFGGEAPAGVLEVMQSGTRGADESQAPSGWLSLRDPDDRRALVFSACRSAETAAESTKDDGAAYGRFTHALVQALTDTWQREGQEQTPWRELPWRDIRDRVAERVTADQPAQHPTIDGLDPMPPAAELRKHAVLIGIDKYRRRPLETPVRDTTVLARELEDRHGYDSVDLLQDGKATLDGIRELFKSFQERRGIGEDSAVLIYFAGHGEAAGDALGSFEGFLLPQDADFEERDRWLEMSELREMLDRLGCRHLLLVLDCCFAGAFAFHRAIPRRRRLYRSQYDRYLRSNAWQLLTSATHNQLARDVAAKRLDDNVHSPFAAALLRGLRGEADAFRDGVITATDLFQYLESELETVPGGQTPGLAPLTPESTGQFLFRTPGVDLDPLPDPRLDPSTIPWRGLEPYGENDAVRFFGRRQPALELLGCLDPELAEPTQDASAYRSTRTAAVRIAGTSGLLAVVGPSGSGKSSLVQAGLLPLLTGGGASKSGAEPGRWAIGRVPRLGASPERQLSAAVEDLAATAAGRRLLFVDQFEELYTRCPEAPARAEFLELLRRRITAGDWVVITLRSDFQSRAAADLGAAFRALPVPELKLDELREIIERPAERSAMFFAPGLVDRMIDEVKSTPCPLPLLSVALAGMYAHAWERWRETDDRELRQEDYRAVGGVAGALRERAAKLYESANAAKQRTIRRVFLRLVSLEGGHRTRRRVAEQELDFADRQEHARVGEVLTEWTRNRFLVRSENTVEPANNALIQEWGMIDGWLEKSPELVPLLRNAWREAMAWRAGKARLWDADPRLPQLAEQRAELNRIEQDFLDASVRRKRWRRSALAAVIAAVMLLLAGAALYSAQQAERADTARRQGLISQLAAQSRALRETRLDQALLLGLQARRLLQVERASGETVNLRENTTLGSFIAQSPPGDEVASRLTHEVSSSLLAGVGHHPRLRRFLRRTDHAVVSVAFSPDGTTLASGYHDGEIVLWDARTNRPLGEPLPGHDNAAWALAWSPDGKKLASAGSDSLILLTDVDSREHVEFGYHEGAVTGVSFRPDGKTVASTGFDGDVVLWDLWPDDATGRSIGEKQRPVRGVAYRPDGEVLATAGDGGQVVTWVADTGERIDTFRDHEIGAFSLAWNPDGTRLASGGVQGTIVLRGAEEPAKRLEGHEGWVMSLAFSPDGRFLASGGRDTTVRLWDAETGQQIGEPFIGHDGSVSSVSFSPESRLLASAGWDEAIILWEIGETSPALRAAAPAPSGLHTEVAWSPDGLWFAAPDLEGGILLRQRETGEDYLLEEHQEAVQSLAFSHDGRLLASGGNDFEILIWDVGTRRVLTTLEGHQETVWALAWSRDSETLASLSADYELLLWQVSREQDVDGRPTVSSQRLPPLSEHQDRRIMSLAWSPTADVLAVGDSQDISLSDLSEREPDRLHGHLGPVQSLAFSPDGRLLASGGMDLKILVWDVAQKRQHGPSLTGHTATVRGLAWSPDGRVLASGSWDETVGIWDIATGQPLDDLLPGHTDDVWNVAFSPDGKTLASGGLDQVRLWDFDIESWRARACRRANRELTEPEWRRFLGGSAHDVPLEPVCTDIFEQ